ncbi:outer membrane protein assembly factor BamC [Aliivibrio sp. S4TY2]|uniref:outer membrane protein assembly factor BamC n=1 Tax=unclassified Aliivibrio TaxID=2645654 RepID=UPI0023796005|nr:MULTISPECIES: outer membrane protein assembly factor BamC [unclassified Aliivibrio]MDD9154845.1 outer membrane protein assembly factor BamC [Aliivibrio sp. S4TY2]MDD9158792.1 outer membrane protein assembly factor BamC [Aliivibrio sp. S4TY1]MDD9162848.1 outer membrane protein assembly factor BamC [Aliivibrio sp. S4MY2]MDD9166791.1 outer membrane protein assembly factor BamC [Aliivibrio sp. S4MY4]MDD9183925.1 outer membrane protein assembly factor BamC [Aliivibrio sp. S4MY3]
MKVKTRFVVGSLMIAVLSACSSSPTERRQAKQDFKYLDTPPLEEWKQPAEAKPEFYPQYDIPKGEYSGGVGKDVDIRPPQQVLELIPGARIEEQKGEVTVWLVKEEDVDKLWQTVLTLIEKRDIDIVSQSDDKIETDWLKWNSEDEDHEFGARYNIEKLSENNRSGFQITLIDWQVDGKQTEVTQANKARYNILMTNLVTSAYDEQLREEARIRAEELVKRIPISMGQDRSGLPVIIARAPYNIFWERLGELLPMMGLTIEDRNRSQGTIEVKYKEPDDEFWEEIGTKPLSFEGSTYNLLLGDLGNRTSINVTDAAGKPVDEATLDSVVPVLAAMIEKSNKMPKEKAIEE